LVWRGRYFLLNYSKLFIFERMDTRVLYSSRNLSFFTLESFITTSVFSGHFHTRMLFVFVQVHFRRALSFVIPFFKISAVANVLMLPQFSGYHCSIDFSVFLNSVFDQLDSTSDLFHLNSEFKVFI